MFHILDENILLLFYFQLVTRPALCYIFMFPYNFHHPIAFKIVLIHVSGEPVQYLQKNSWAFERTGHCLLQAHHYKLEATKTDQCM